MNPVEQVVQQAILGAAVRENHALEHATIVLLSKRFPEARLSGISFATGFFVFGDVSTEAVKPTAIHALERLRGGEPEMAIHERCGTNLAVAGMLTGICAMSVARMRKPYNSLNNVVLASTLALVVSRPLGLLVQRYVTTRTPSRDMKVVDVQTADLPGQSGPFRANGEPERQAAVGAARIVALPCQTHHGRRCWRAMGREISSGGHR